MGDFCLEINKEMELEKLSAANEASSSYILISNAMCVQGIDLLLNQDVSRQGLIKTKILTITICYVTESEILIDVAHF